MADTVNIGWNYSIAKDSQSNGDTHSYSYTPASHYKGFSVIQQAPTSVTTISFAPASTVGSFSVKNLDAANYVELYTVVGGTNPFARIAAGKSLPPIPAVPGASYFIKANNAAVYFSVNFDGAT